MPLPDGSLQTRPLRITLPPSILLPYTQPCVSSGVGAPGFGTYLALGNALLLDPRVIPDRRLQASSAVTGNVRSSLAIATSGLWARGVRLSCGRLPTDRPRFH